jgi:simple sugar transport system ATP-binding protein
MGIVPNLSVRENLLLKGYRHPPFSRWFFLNAHAAAENARRAIALYQIATPSDSTPVKLLSGGNIQRLVLAREFSGDPRLIIAAHPTYGLDVGATEQVRQLLLKERGRGAAILLTSEDLEEILAVSDRILVMFSGEVMGTLEAEGADLGEIGLLMAGTRQKGGAV